MLIRSIGKSGKRNLFSFIVFRKHKIDPKVGFIRTGGYDIGQEEELYYKPLKLFNLFLESGDMSFYLHLFNNSVSDGFKNNSFYFLDTINNSLFLFDTLNNRVKTYTSFVEKKFKKMSYANGTNKVLKVFVKEVRTNFVEGNVWLLHRYKEDNGGKPLNVYENGKLIKDNLQEIDVLGEYLNYHYTVCIVPPKKYPLFIVESIAITGENEGYAIARLKRKGVFGLYFLRFSYKKINKLQN
jgi:hypothetical protein